MNNFIEIPIRIYVSNTTQLILKELDAMDEHLKLQLSEDFLDVISSRQKSMNTKDLDILVRTRALDILDQMDEVNYAD